MKPLPGTRAPMPTPSAAPPAPAAAARARTHSATATPSVRKSSGESSWARSQKPDAADDDQHRHPAQRAAVELAARVRGGEQDQREHDADDQARRVGRRERRREQRGGERRRPWKQRGLGQVRSPARWARRSRCAAPSPRRAENVASSVFHGSWPAMPERHPARAQQHQAELLDARNGPTGSPPRDRWPRGCQGRDADGRRRCGVAGGLCREASGRGRCIPQLRRRTKKAAAAALFVTRTRGSGGQRRAPRALGPVALAELVDAARGVHRPSACPCRTGGTASRPRRGSTCSTVERVLNLLPQLQVTWISAYFGWMDSFMPSSLVGPAGRGDGARERAVPWVNR